MGRFTVFLYIIILISCQDKVICPAFQSTYILDDSTRNACFSYVWQLDELTRSQYLLQQQSGDSTETIKQPTTDYYAHARDYVVPWRVPRRSKYGIIKPVFYPVKKHRMRTAPMENVLTPALLSNDFDASEFETDSLQSDTVNLVALDSVAIDLTTAANAQDNAPQKEEVRYLHRYDPSDIFNVEQAYYNKYFANRLIDHRPPPESEGVVSDSLSAAVPDSLTKKTPFFKRIFKKKDQKWVNKEPANVEEENLLELTEEEFQEEPVEDDSGQF